MINLETEEDNPNLIYNEDTIIPGMDKIINHIREKEQEILELKDKINILLKLINNSEIKYNSSDYLNKKENDIFLKLINNK